jgi:hypothetical protein
MEERALPKPLVKLKRLVFTGLEQTASLWTPLAVAYDWVHQVAMLLDNETGQDAHTPAELESITERNGTPESSGGELADGIEHFQSHS